jgi:hypothetical protein
MLLDDKGAICPTGGQVVKRPQGGGSEPEFGSVRQICLWLDKNSGDIMKRSKIGSLLNVHENLSPELRKRIEKTR